jgi:hypothetical protein
MFLNTFVTSDFIAAITVKMNPYDLKSEEFSIYCFPPFSPLPPLPSSPSSPSTPLLTFPASPLLSLLIPHLTSSPLLSNNFAGKPA